MLKFTIDTHHFKAFFGISYLLPVHIMSLGRVSTIRWGFDLENVKVNSVKTETGETDTTLARYCRLQREWKGWLGRTMERRFRRFLGVQAPPSPSIPPSAAKPPNLEHLRNARKSAHWTILEVCVYHELVNLTKLGDSWCYRLDRGLSSMSLMLASFQVCGSSEWGG